ncbi:MAG TPA: hypothetical protein V6D02_09885 [Candidatus Obscuribacterales bacterium]
MKPLHPRYLSPLPLPKFWRHVASAIALGALTLTPASPVGAVVPDEILIEDIIGNSSELIIRRSNNREPIQIGSLMQRVRDVLVTVPPTNTHADLRFRADGQPLDLMVKTDPHAEAMIYYFPCHVQGGEYHIGWGLAANEAARGCENGITVEPTGTASTQQVPPAVATALYKQVAQSLSLVRQVSYCSAAGSGGAMGFATSTAADPCVKAIADCEAEGGGCEVTAIGSWWSNTPELQATLTCEDGPRQTIAGAGDALQEAIPELLAQVEGEGCGVQVYRSTGLLVMPKPAAAVAALGGEVLIRTQATAEGVQVEVINGGVDIQAAGLAEPVSLVRGDRYVYAQASGTKTTFDRDAALKSVNMEVLCAFAINSEDPLEVAACQEGLAINTLTATPVEYCNREQASGGSAGDRRVLQMTANQGVIQLDYEMYQVPDRIEIFYEGRTLLDTGFISGTDSLTIPFAGQSGRMEVVVTGNTVSDTQWNYLLRCP